MLFKVKKQTTEEVVVELKLPAFYKEVGDWYLMITENETIVRVSPICKGACIVTCTKDCINHPNYMEDCMKATPVTPYEFFKAWHLIMDHLEEEMHQPLLNQ